MRHAVRIGRLIGAGLIAAAAVVALGTSAAAAAFPPGPSVVGDVDALDAEAGDVAAVLAAAERAPLIPCI